MLGALKSKVSKNSGDVASVARPRTNEPPKRQQPRDLSEPTVLNMFIRFWKAHEAYKDESGGAARKQHAQRKQALLSEVQIETALKTHFNAQVERLRIGEIKSFTFKIDRRALAHFDVIVKAPEYKLLEIREISPFMYHVTLCEEIVFE